MKKSGERECKYFLANIKGWCEVKDEPKVSILIPTFNRPKFLNKSLMSAVMQSYKNIEIVICDDSTNYESKQVVSKYMKRYKNIRYYFNNGPLGKFGLNNMNRCYKLSKGKYINFLNDDDKFHENKIMKMVECIQGYKNISLVTSHRGIIDKNDKVLRDINATKRIKYVNRPISGREVARTIFSRGNFIGEPTTVLFKKEHIKKFGRLWGKQFCALVDIAAWLQLLSKGRFIYLSDTLSYFRIHDKQNTNKSSITRMFSIEWKELNYYAYKIGIINTNEYKQFLIQWKGEHSNIKA
ncbi:glycosyltransferase family 2 protein [Clostridium felsineum]|uniref:glycosyltransferase family 2 protein n=1 Tax=Clostridium felsineum TaxID=36839 RepID=UPI00214DA703|nr:glycosyltransferase family 2 protein [Clostridium felsineum]